MNNTNGYAFKPVSRDTIADRRRDKWGILKPLFDAIAALPVDQIMEVEVPKGRNRLSVRNGIVSAAKLYKIKVKVSVVGKEPAVYVWRID